MLPATELIKRPDLLDHEDDEVSRPYRLKVMDFRDHLIKRLNYGELSEVAYNRLEVLMIAADQALYGEAGGVFKIQ